LDPQSFSKSVLVRFSQQKLFLNNEMQFIFSIDCQTAGLILKLKSIENLK